MIGHQVAFLDLRFLVSCQRMEYLAEMAPEVTAQCPATTLRDEHYVIFALPLGVA
jgi:hypothetical protein